jgi:hypothetical protein
MDKKKLILAFIEQLKTDLQALIEAARATYEAATHEESKAENQYDTRGLEASYLAGAQAKRVSEIDEVLGLFQRGSFRNFQAGDPIADSALVEVESKKKRSYVFLLPTGGGVSLTFEGNPVHIITPNSVLGEAMMGLCSGDVAEIEIGDQIREYKILSVL